MMIALAGKVMCMIIISLVIYRLALKPHLDLELITEGISVRKKYQSDNVPFSCLLKSA